MYHLSIFDREGNNQDQKIKYLGFFMQVILGQVSHVTTTIISLSLSLSLSLSHEE